MQQSNKHKAVYFNGLGPEGAEPTFTEKLWQRYMAWRGIDVTVSRINWHTGESFEDDLLPRAVDDAKELLRQFGGITIIGASAGAGMGANVYHAIKTEQPDADVALICISGCLKVIDAVRHRRVALCRPSKKASASYLASVQHCSDIVQPWFATQPKDDIDDIVTLYDQTIPTETMTIDDVRTHRAYAVGHIPGIAAGWLMSARLIKQRFKNRAA